MLRILILIITIALLVYILKDQTRRQTAKRILTSIKNRVSALLKNLKKFFKVSKNNFPLLGGLVLILVFLAKRKLFYQIIIGGLIFSFLISYMGKDKLTRNPLIRIALILVSVMFFAFTLQMFLSILG